MKKILPAFTIAAVMAACNSNSKTGAEDATVISSSDTVGLSEFQAWKAQNELTPANRAFAQGYAEGFAAAGLTASKQSAVNYASARKTLPKSYASNSRRSYSSGSNGSMSSTSSNTAKRSKWSKAAKGAAIGGGSGAILGAVVHKKNRGVGAVVGGVAGAGVGYGIGRHLDKKDGRY
ncbi:MAG: glycine zipper domain-containing protein [Chitinophagaceae bacterium]